MRQIIINGMPIELEKKKIKNMYLKILPPDGRIHVSAPIRMKEEDIKAFVMTKLDWIRAQQQKLHLKEYPQEVKYQNGDTIPLWGQNYHLIVKESDSRGNVVRIGENLLLTVKKDSTAEQREKIINTWYRSILGKEIPILIAKWEEIIGVKSNSFTIRDMKTRWGSCNIKSHNICLNLQLIKKPPECLEYVVVHELVHLLERSHNQVFKSYMNKFLPLWRVAKWRLNG